MTPSENPTRLQIAFYLLLIVVGLLIVGRLDYADAVITENARLHTALAAERATCSADIEHLDRIAPITHLEM